MWIVERRGTQGRHVPPGVRRGWNEAVHKDLLSAQRFISAQSATPAVWIGHSYGGTIISRALGEHTLTHDTIAGVVLVGSAIDVPLMRSRLLRKLARARFWNDPLPTHILGFGPEDEYRDQLDDMFTSCDIERVAGHTAATLATVTTPLLTMPGRWDLLSPPTTCDRLAHSYASTDKQRIQISRRNGFTSNLGHDTLLMNNRHPRIDVFDAITTWIETHTTAITEDPQ
ncbi:alpha/beta hydrolase [Gordonia sp. NPDC003950]